MILDKEEVQKQHEAAKDYIIRLKEEVAAAKEMMNSALQVSAFFSNLYCFVCCDTLKKYKILSKANVV